MIETWRWFGPRDPITLADVRQTGATGVVTALHEVPPGVAWSAEDIVARKGLIARAGLTWEVCESIPVPDAIKRGGAEARQAIGAWTDTLVRLGRAGVPVVCYNFMPVLDWTRTALDHTREDGAQALRFDPVDFAACDLFILGRDGAGDYPSDLVVEAEARVAAMEAPARRRLVETVIAGLPGGAVRRTPEGLLDEIAAFDGVTRDDVAAALRAFLQAVVPVAEEVGVRLAIHPDDPPVPLFGLPRVISTAEDAEAVLRAVDSPANGLTFCTGSYGARVDNDVDAMAERFAARVSFAHLRNVSVEPGGAFEEAAHLGGRTDMVRVMRALRAAEHATGRKIPFRSDHGHLFSREAEVPSNPGYSYIGRLRGLAELRGIGAALSAGEAGGPDGR